MSSIAFSKLSPTFSMLESCLKKSGADFSISCAFLSCFTETYVYIPGKMTKGANSMEDGKFNANEIRYIALFESMTGAMVKDCIIDDELSKVTFVVKNGDMGLAIGKGGSTVTKVKRAVDKGVEIIEYNEDPAQFIRNILSPAELKSIKVIQKEGQDKIAIVNADSSNKRIAIGKNGVNIERAKLLAKRQHDISNIILK